MEFEFDKQIDALLRQSAPGETTFAATNPKSEIRNPKPFHLDADEISAFAENALPEKTRGKYLRHLADCDECRKNLSNLIRLNAEETSEIVHTEEKLFAAAPIPWYRNFFAVPNLVYTMGALVLVFSGIAFYTILQSVNNTQNSEVSQTYEKQSTGKGMSSDGDAEAVESYSSNAMTNSNMAMSNAVAMNSASNAQANFSAVPSAPTATTNSNAAVSREATDKDAKGTTKPLVLPQTPIELPKTVDSVVAGSPPPAPAKENEYQTTDADQVQRQRQQLEMPTQNSIAQNQTNITPDSRNVQRAPMLASRAENKSKKLEESREDKAGGSVNATPTTSVGGKTFKRENNVWYDSAYRGQKTINVARGTNEYKKLDAGLRGIAENLGGTVVIVWKQKSYRIQ